MLQVWEMFFLKIDYYLFFVVRSLVFLGVFVPWWQILEIQVMKLKLPLGIIFQGGEGDLDGIQCQ